MVSKTKKMIFVSALAISLLTAGAYGAKLTFAQDGTVQETIVQKIASKFNLKVEDVQAVFDQERAARQAEMEQRYEQKLSELVTAGKISDAQKQLLIAKHKELEVNRQSQMSSWRSMTVDERKTAMEKQKSDLESWAKANGIDSTYLFGFGRGEMHQGGKRGMMGDNN
jgi:hypothetical protein